MQRKKQPGKLKTTHHSTTANLSQVFSTLGAERETADICAQIISNPQRGFTSLMCEMLSNPKSANGKINQMEAFIHRVESDIETVENRYLNASLQNNTPILKSELGQEGENLIDAYDIFKKGLEQDAPGFKVLASLENNSPFAEALIRDMEIVEAQWLSFAKEDENSKKMLEEQLNLLSIISSLANLASGKRNQNHIEGLESKLVSYQKDYVDNVGSYILQAAFHQIRGDHQTAEHFYKDGLKHFPEEGKRINSYLHTFIVEVQEKEELKETKNQRKKRLAREEKELAATQGDAAASHYTSGSPLPEEARTSKKGPFGRRVF